MAELIEFEVREDGSRVVKRNIEEVGRSMEQVAASVDLMKSALATIQGTIKSPVSSLQQMRSALQALSAAMNAPGALFDPKIINFATAAISRLKETVSEFARTAPSNVQAAIGRINIGIEGLERQAQRAARAQQLMMDAQKNIQKISQPQQMGFDFMTKPMTISGPGWQLEGKFKSVATSAKEAAGTIASLAAPTQQFAQAANKASTSAQQMNLNLGAANQTSFAFMNGMQTMTKPVNAAAAQYQTVGQVWTKNTQQAQQLAFGFMNAGNATQQAAQQAAAAAANVNGLTTSFWNLRNALYVLTTVLFLRELRDYIDTWIMVENSVRLSTKTQEESNAVFAKLTEAASRARIPIEELIHLYRRMAQAQTSLGASQQEMIDTVEGIGMALAIQGTSTHDARGALLQLGQAFGMARVRAQEFNSINENAPRILMGIARNIPEAHGNIERLRQLMIKGGITGRQFFAAFQKDLPNLRKEFELVRPTIGQAFAVMNNKMGEFIYNGDKAVGISTVFAKGVIWLANNLKAASLAVMAVTGAVVVAGWATLTAWISKAAISVHAFTAALAANPLGLLAVGLTVAAAALYAYRDELIFNAETSATLGDYMRSWWSGIERAASSATRKVKEFWDYMSGVKTGQFEQDAGNILTKGMSLAVEAIKSKINEQIGWIVFSAHAMEIVYQNSADVIRLIFVNMWNELGSQLEKWMNEKLMWINIIRMALGKEPIILDIQIKDKTVAAASADLAKKLGSAFLQDMSTDWIGETMKAWSAQANRFAMDRQLKQGEGVNLNIKPPTDPPVGDLNKLQKELDRLRATIDPTWAAMHHLADAERILNEAVEKDLIKREEANDWLDRAREHYNDALHPVDALIASLYRENDAMGLASDKRRAHLKTLEQEKQLKKAGVTITDELTQSLDRLNLANIRGQKVSQEMVRLDDEINGKHKNLSYQVEALGRLLEEKQISQEDYTFALAKLKTEANSADFGQAFITRLREMGGAVKSFTVEAGKLTAKFVDDFATGLSNAIATAIVEWRNFKKLFEDLAKMIVTQLIASFIRLGMQMAINAAAGQTMAQTAVAANAVMATETATAWATAASMVSLASFGLNAAPAMAAMAETTGFALALASAKPGFMSGGYTGDLPFNSVAGVVHGQEFVVNAPATAANRDVLEAMNRGERVTGQSVNIQIDNYSSADISVERITANEIRIIAKQEAHKAVREAAPAAVAADLHNPNGKVQGALRRTTKIERKFT